jgi:hypothetical protein
LPWGREVASQDMTTALVLVAVVVGVAALVLNAIATVGLVKARPLTTAQKVAQLLVVWAVPFIGALLVIRLLVEQDPDALRRRWTPSRQINEYVNQALGIQAQAATRAARIAIENEIIEAISEGSSGNGSSSD